jgi:hypothetical protein
LHVFGCFQLRGGKVQNGFDARLDDHIKGDLRRLTRHGEGDHLKFEFAGE